MKKFQNLLIILFATVCLTNCGSDDAPTTVTQLGGIKNQVDADAFLLATYSDFVIKSTYLESSLIMPILYSDDATTEGNSKPQWSEAANFNLDADNETISDIIDDIYLSSARVRVLIDEVDTTEDLSLTEDVKAGLTAEALAIRGLLHFNLKNYWANVPVFFVEDASNFTDSLIEPQTDASLFDLIEEDWLFAINNISKNNLSSGNQRLNEWSVKALLARLYLYQGDFSKALQYAKDVIDNSGASLESNLNNVYTINSTENIWVLPENTTTVVISPWFLPTFAGGQHVVVPRENDFFEEGDKRKAITFNTPGNTILKYKNALENSDPIYMIRLAEMYLIAAEGEARGNNDYDAASTYLNVIRSRAGLEDLTLTSGNLQDAILQERRAELCYEGNFRWLDLKRFGIAETTLAQYGYSSKNNLWPIPTDILERYSNLVQNSGY